MVTRDMMLELYLRLSLIKKFSKYDYHKHKQYIEYLLKEYKNSGAAFVKKFYKKYTNASDLGKTDHNEIMLVCKGYYSVKTAELDLNKEIVAG